MRWKLGGFSDVWRPRTGELPAKSIFGNLPVAIRPRGDIRKPRNAGQNKALFCVATCRIWHPS
jgi:hypothetical protein